jgi:hypothetical protein
MSGVGFNLALFESFFISAVCVFAVIGFWAIKLKLNE